MQRLLREPYSIWLVYLGVATAIMLPLLLPGYVLTLDMVFVPHPPLPTELSNAYILDVLLWALTFIVPGDIVQKIMLFAILVLGGIGAHWLVKNLAIPEGNAPNYWRWAPYFAGIFYMVNPFVYSRFMAGQWQILIGYTLLPFFVRALLQLIAKPERKTAVQAGLLLGGIGLVSVHMLGVALVAGSIGAGIAAWQTRRKPRQFKQGIKWAAICVGTAVILNSFWLVPSLLGHTPLAQATASFNDAQFAAFATNGHTPLEAIGSVMQLQGFWLESRGLYTLPQQWVPGWAILIIAMWALVGMGFKAGIKTAPLVTKFAAGIIIAGIILAATPLIDWLRHIIPFVAGYREPHKFTALVVLGVAVLGAIGVAKTARFVRRKWNEPVAGYSVIGLLLLPVIVTPVMLWGFGGQLQPNPYPADWYAMNKQLNNLPRDGSILFLPWHQYMFFGFAGRIIATPADKFFDQPIIVSDDPEFKNVPPTLPNSYKQKVQAALRAGDAPAQLAALGIKYVLVAKEYDYDFYTVRQSPDMRLMVDNESFELYKNNAKATP